jgi:hypothetical protein
MNVTYTDQAGQGDGLLQRATALLEEVIGPASGRVSAAWGREENGRGRPVYTLRLIDGPEEVTAAFTPEELRDARALRYRFIRLWGDLLQTRSHRQLKELVGAESEAGE